MVDRDRADLVDQHRAVGERRLAQHPVEQRGLAAAEEAGEDVQRQSAGHGSSAARNGMSASGSSLRPESASALRQRSNRLSTISVFPGRAAHQEARALPVVDGDARGFEHLADDGDAAQPLAAECGRVERRRRIEPAAAARRTCRTGRTSFVVHYFRRGDSRRGEVARAISPSVMKRTPGCLLMWA